MQKSPEKLYMGIDIGSTTVKVVVMNERRELLHRYYGRHYSKVREKTAELVADLEPLLSGRPVCAAIAGSAGLGVSKLTGIAFVQEVYATRLAVDAFLGEVDAVIELGGEDAKILFLTGGTEERMNGTCAGGTGAFIDQMASLLSVSVEELDRLSFSHEKIYNIASRCGVFAKSDIQPLMNQGANKADLAASIYQAIVDQTLSGLAQGRRIKGRVAFLGGPLTFQLGLRERFVETLRLDGEHALFPENAEYYVAMGAAIYASTLLPGDYGHILDSLVKACGYKNILDTLPPLFASRKDYDEFVSRHSQSDVPAVDITTYEGTAYLGIDAGSTTTKLVLITPDGGLLYSFYKPNSGEPLPLVREQLQNIRRLCGRRIRIAASAVTGYGEDLIKNAFHLDGGVVETAAHYYAARHFNPQVDFILDIGGQDIKCFKIKNEAVDSIMLNEACSSGCGSFIETFASSLGYTVEDFAREALFAKHPVNLGTRCTVFMNSSVKQAQKDGAGVDDISAGLAMSVIKNALYKVIRAKSPDELGEHIVVQGGTFLNDAILRSFELETGRRATRPAIAGLMGAFGAALYAKSLNAEESSLLSEKALESFTHSAKVATCGLCTNRCKLTINLFSGKDRFISGNRCERPLGRGAGESLPNAYAYKLKRLLSFAPAKDAPRGRIGLPLGLNMYENLPFWHTLLTGLGFEVVLSGAASRNTYLKGQFTIPSDTVCYPAKLMHGHIEELLEQGVDTIFYPCMTYNFNERTGDNHYNCPVVAYYPELLEANVSHLANVRFLKPFFALHDRDKFRKCGARFFEKEFGVGKKEFASALPAAYDAYEAYIADVRAFGEAALRYARENGKRVLVVAGRPYHIDPEINHGIDQLMTSLGLVVVSEDCVAHLVPPRRVKVLNQWTYHSRLYNAAEYVTTQPDIELCQLVSFGCGLDAITSDEVRDILESRGKFYTQIKIDEINNLGAARIRLRSLLAAMDSRSPKAGAPGADGPRAHLQKTPCAHSPL